MKSVFVSDSVHGSIKLSHFEKQIISTQIFNRLHNILQNSTVYFTYPSNRISRFSHSLGTMHLAGEIYYRGVLNAADPAKRRRFLDDLKDEIGGLIVSDAFQAAAGSLLSEDFRVARFLEQPLKLDEVEVFYQEHLLSSPDGDSGNATACLRGFLVGFQAIRLAGLLHDLGHPPLSHVSEFALGELKSELSESKELTEREVQFLRILSTVENETGNLHEGIGRYLAEKTLSRAVRAIRKRERTSDAQTTFYLLCQHLALRILRNETPFSRAIHCIVDSDFDADRLDYVTRDCQASGISAEPFRYERLRNGIRLVYHKSRGGCELPFFIPSVRSLSDLERFFKLYQDLYKYVIYHHRVARTDGLMKEAICQLARDYLRDEKGQADGPQKHGTLDDISLLWNTLDLRSRSSAKECVEAYIQWDDPWLITMLRNAYFSAASIRDENNIREPGLLEMRLEEILSNRRYYYSLYKGIDTFIAVDKAFITELPRQFGIASLFTESERTSEKVKDQIAVADSYLKQYWDGEPLPTIRARHGFFTCVVRVLWQRVGRTQAGGRMEFSVRAAKSVLSDYSDRFGLSDVLVIPKLLKRGLDENFLLHDEGEVMELQSVSRLAHDLENNVNLFPPFFTYFSCVGHLNEEQLSTLRSEFGQRLASSLVSSGENDINPE